MALLCTLRLLRQLPPGAQPAVHCHVFACPAIGNEALALYVKERGWERYFSNMLIPGDPKLMTVMNSCLKDWCHKHQSGEGCCQNACKISHLPRQQELHLLHRIPTGQLPPVNLSNPCLQGLAFGPALY